MDFSLLKDKVDKSKDGHYTVSRESLNELLPEGLKPEMVDLVKNWESDVMVAGGQLYKELLSDDGYTDRDDAGELKHKGDLPQLEIDYSEKGKIGWGGTVNERASIYGSMRTNISESAESVKNEIAALFN